MEVFENEVDKELAEQRDESDARSIINEVEKVNTLEGRFRYRWIWELLQNAKDEAGDGADIVVTLSDSVFSFMHNGRPFLAKNLLALLRRTSTKPITGADGNTGKFGTGFVTSHLLNKVVNVSGVYKNANGCRNFSMEINRKPTDLDEMKVAIATGIQTIREIELLPAQTDELNPYNEFSYELKEATHKIAEGAIQQLLDNLAFTMLVNKQINSLEIQNAGNKIVYSPYVKEAVANGIDFIQLRATNDEQTIAGLLIYRNQKVIVASPAFHDGNQYCLLPIGGRSRLFKDLPLIGTEGFYIPVIFQHSDFYPTEQRDGIRTKISPDAQEEDDKVATNNRKCFSEFVQSFKTYMKLLIEGKVNNLHLLAESGFPTNVDQYYDPTWYRDHIQMPIRSALQEHELVRTVSGLNISVAEAKFPRCDNNHLDQMFELLSAWYPDNCPDKASMKDWVRIIEQETENWPENITVSVEDLVKAVAEKKKLDAFPMGESEGLVWIQQFISFLENCGLERFGHDYGIYPNRLGELSIQSKVFHDPGVNERFFSISEGMGRKLESELLPKNFKAKFVEPFDTKVFLNELNTEIGNLGLKIDKASAPQIDAIIKLCCTFKPSRAEKRELWFELLNQLLPEKANAKVEIEFSEDYQWETAEKAALRYVSHLIQTSVTTEAFSSTYFDNDSSKTFEWLSKFYDFVFRNEENKSAALAFKIVATQDGNFKLYTDNLFLEEEQNLFDDEIKNLYKEFCGKGDPRAFIICKEITCSEIRSAPLQQISRVIDDLLNSRDSEDKVAEGGKYHSLFLRLKNWLEAKENFVIKDYFPIYAEKEPILYVKAFGGATFSRLLKLKRSVEELEALDKLGLTATEMAELDSAVSQLGSAEQLIQKAKEMIEYADFVRWRQYVGKAAEDAFLEAIAEADSNFLNPENPDDGKDFVIRLNGKEYAIELKSAVEGKENVNMSLKQGETAVAESDRYALCVISRPAGQITDKAEFMAKAKFIINIGSEIGTKIENFKSGIDHLTSSDNVKVELDSKTGAVYVNKAIWSAGISFDEFIEHLKAYFKISNL